VADWKPESGGTGGGGEAACSLDHLFGCTLKLSIWGVRAAVVEVGGKKVRAAPRCKKGRNRKGKGEGTKNNNITKHGGERGQYVGGQQRS